MNQQHEEVIKQFKSQAEHFSNKGLNQSNQEYIRWILERLQLDPRYSVLDVAAGTGILSRAVSPYVHSVTAIDLSPDMIERGRSETNEQEFTNISYIQGMVEELPYPKENFDLAVCRFAFHHFEDPEKVLREMTRVCKSGRSIAVIDLIAPEDAILADRYNYYENLRDPSHRKAFTKRELLTLFHKTGFKFPKYASIQVQVHLSDWLQLTNTSLNARKKIMQDIEAEWAGKFLTGLFPSKMNGLHIFSHNYCLVIGTKH